MTVRAANVLLKLNYLQSRVETQCRKIIFTTPSNIRVRLHVTEMKSHPEMKKFLFTREFHPGMKRVEFHPGM